MQRSYYAIIPANVRYSKELTPNAKLLYGEITALCNERGYCWATNSYFSELYGVSTKSISKWINQLIENGYVVSKIKYKEGSKEIETRFLAIAVTPMEEKFHTYGTEVLDPMEEKFHTPMEEKVKDNTTSFNNTTNSSSSGSSKSNSLLRDEQLATLTKFYDENIQRMTGYIHECIIHMMKENEPELVMEAFKIAAGRQPDHPLKYIEGTLEKWRNKSIKTLQDLQAKEAREQNEKSQGSSNRQPTRGNHGRNETEIPRIFGNYKSPGI